MSILTSLLEKIEKEKVKEQSAKIKLLDFEKMIAIIKQSSYEGYIAIEYEGAMLNLFGGKGNYLNPHEGVIATKALLEKLI